MDTITIYCGKCGKKLEAKAVEAGGAMKCSKCGVRIPIPSSNLDRPQIRIFCVKCGSRLRAWPEEAGKHVECRRCKKLISLPSIEREDEEKPKAKSLEKRREPKEKSDLISFTSDRDIEREEVKIEPVKKRREDDLGILNFDEKDSKAAPRKAKKTEQKRSDNEDGMISFDEFLVDDAKPKKKARSEAEKEERQKPRLTADELRRSRSDTDALPPSKPGLMKPVAHSPAQAKTLVLQCKSCGMRLVFKNKKPMPGAECPSCGHQLVR